MQREGHLFSIYKVLTRDSSTGTVTLNRVLLSLFFFQQINYKRENKHNFNVFNLINVHACVKINII